MGADLGDLSVTPYLESKSDSGNVLANTTTHAEANHLQITETNVDL